jgi:hypothetical protein
MAPIQKETDDLVILNRTGPDVRGGLVEVYELTGPGIEPQSVMRTMLEEAKHVGRARAKERRVSLWYDPDPIADRGVQLVETFRPDA